MRNRTGCFFTVPGVSGASSATKKQLIQVLLDQPFMSPQSLLLSMLRGGNHGEKRVRQIPLIHWQRRFLASRKNTIVTSRCIFVPLLTSRRKLLLEVSGSWCSRPSLWLRMSWPYIGKRWKSMSLCGAPLVLLRSSFGPPLAFLKCSYIVGL